MLSEKRSTLDRLMRSAAWGDIHPDALASARCLARLLGDPTDYTLHPSHFTLYWSEGKQACINYRKGWVTN